MRTGNAKSAIVATAAGITFLLGAIAAAQYLPETIIAYFQHLQNPTADSLVTAITYIVVAFVAFAVPTSMLGAVLAVIGNADV